MTKQLLDWNWYSNGRRIYYEVTREVKEADARTFEVLNHVWARDDSRVFERDKWLRRADRETFVVLNELFARDAETVFHTEGPLKGADAGTFVTFPSNDECVLRSYAKDRHNVYHRIFTIGKPVVVRNADPESFHSVGRGYGIDDESVFYETSRLPKADPASCMFQRFQSCDLAEWLGRRWIWFFHPLRKPNSHRITPMLRWRDFSAIEDLNKVRSLVAELRATSAA